MAEEEELDFDELYGEADDFIELDYGGEEEEEEEQGAGDEQDEQEEVAPNGETEHVPTSEEGSSGWGGCGQEVFSPLLCPPRPSLAPAAGGLGKA
eukprot:gene25115-10756_t